MPLQQIACHACTTALPVRSVTTPAVTRGIPPTLARGPECPLAPQMAAKGMRPAQWLVLASSAERELRTLFSRFQLDLTRLVFSIGWAFGQDGITFGRTIFLSREFGAQSYIVQLGLLAHEITHSVQYAKVGWPAFAARYLREWYESGGHPYMRRHDPGSERLDSRAIESVDPLDPAYYLDQLADRFQHEMLW